MVHRVWKKNESNKKEEIFEGKWYAHPSMRNALISGIITGMAVEKKGRDEGLCGYDESRGSLRNKCNCDFEDNTLSKIIHRSEEK